MQQTQIPSSLGQHSNETLPIFYVGGDAGNGDTEMTVHDYNRQESVGSYQEYATRFSSTITTLTAEALIQFQGTEFKTEDGQYLIEMGNRAFLVGKLAEKSGTSAAGSPERYGGQHNLVLLLCGLALCIPRDRLIELGAYNPITEASTFHARVGLSLPYTLHNPERGQAVRKAMTGWHTFSFNRMTYRIFLEVGPVLKEGTGGIILYGNKMARKVCFDVGQWSSEILVVDNGVPQQELCDGKKLGVGEAIKQVKETVRISFKRDLGDDEARSLLLAAAKFLKDVRTQCQESGGNWVWISEERPLTQLVVSEWTIDKVHDQLHRAADVLEKARLERDWQSEAAATLLNGKGITIGEFLDAGHLPSLEAYGRPLSGLLLLAHGMRALLPTGKKIQTFLTSSLSTESGFIGSDMQEARMIGGGPYYFEVFIQDRIPHMHIPNSPPEHVNARANCLAAVKYQKWVSPHVNGAAPNYAASS